MGYHKRGPKPKHPLVQVTVLFTHKISPVSAVFTAVYIKLKATSIN